MTDSLKPIIRETPRPADDSRPLEETRKQIDVAFEKSTDGRWVMGATARDRVNDTIAPRAFANAVEKVASRLIALWQHDNRQPVGYWENLSYKAGKLIGDLKLSETNLGLMIKQLLADGVPLGASIAFTGYGKANDLGGYHYSEIELLETSIVSVPANPLAMRIAKSYGVDLSSTVKADPPARADSGLDGLHEQAILKARAATLAANKILRGYK